ncbi:hypothetical protein Trydic_g20518 [Trypoxylus dichotomus]
MNQPGFTMDEHETYNEGIMAPLDRFEHFSEDNQVLNTTNAENSNRNELHEQTESSSSGGLNAASTGIPSNVVSDDTSYRPMGFSRHVSFADPMMKNISTVWRDARCNIYGTTAMNDGGLVFPYGFSNRVFL